MSYDEGLAQRVREQLQNRFDVVEKNMFGGLCFMISNQMCCGIVNNRLMARVGAANYEKCLSREHVIEMDFTGKTMKGMIYVMPEGLAKDEDLKEWITICTSFVESLPPR